MKTPQELKNLINIKAKELNFSPQTLLNRFFIELFLERLSKSEYKKKFVLKGDVLIFSMAGIALRRTKEIDFVIKPLDKDENIKSILEEIIAIEIEDPTKFTLCSLVPMPDSQGFKARLDVEFDRIRTEIQINIAICDKLILKEFNYHYSLLLENRSIDISSYQIEAILSDKIECILSRSVANARMKDYYDLYILLKQNKEHFLNDKNYDTLNRTFMDTTEARKSKPILKNVDKNIKLIRNDKVLKRSWSAYSKRFAYASGISFEKVVSAFETLRKNYVI